MGLPCFERASYPNVNRCGRDGALAVNKSSNPYAPPRHQKSLSAERRDLAALFLQLFEWLRALFVIACIVVDFFPRFGPPAFRYTGADPSTSVWNLGWPGVLFIYDPRSGVHVGLEVYLVVPAQLFLLALSCVVPIVLRRIVGRHKVSRTADARFEHID